MASRLFELIIDSSDMARNPCRLTADTARLTLPETTSKTYLVLTASSDGLELIANSLGLGDGDIVCVGRSPVPLTELEPCQIAGLFEEIIRHSRTQTDHCLFIGDIDNVYPEIFPDLAWRFDGTYLGICTDIQLSETSGVRATKKTFGGRLKASIECMSHLCFASLRSANKSPRLESRDRNPNVDTPKMTELSLQAIPETGYVVTSSPGSSRAEDTLTDATLIISGGRGLGSEQNLACLKEIAQSMGASWAGSLPAVDAGWVPVTRQVGQSGNYVRPHVYLAIGISGTPQHMAGIDPITRIVAINNDPDASIFLFSEVGVVADCTTFLPVFLAEVQSRT